MDWSWVSTYFPELMSGLVLTLELLLLSVFFGILLAVPIGLVQVTGPWYLAVPARAFCTVIRGTPLLIQVWLLYYGLGSLFPSIPWIRHSFMWPVLREGFFYAVLAFTLSFAGYEGEVVRGALTGVPRGEIEAGRAFGMTPFQVVRRVWLPRAIRMVLPTLAGETVLQLKSTPLAATITVMDLFGVANMIRQETYRIYEPLLLVACIYILLTVIITRLFRIVETQIP
ncbi:MAG: ABC transporter permease subunit, partial [Aestuariivirgaceae bacterium]